MVMAVEALVPCFPGNSICLILRFLCIQIALMMSIVALALVVACALITTAQLQSEESVLFGLGSGEEQVQIYFEKV
jgi:hypothetical protein